MRIKETPVYKFDELDERAKERARDWYRSGAFDFEWWDSVYEDAKACLALAGFRIDNIYFSGFSSQGDGACFEGAWSACDAKPVKAMRAHAPQDKELHRIAARMRALARRDKNAGMSVKQSGRYSHEGCTEFSIDARTEEIGESIRETSRDAMRWIYRQLEKEYEYMNADEQVDESIRINEYEFTAEGKRS